MSMNYFDLLTMIYDCYESSPDYMFKDQDLLFFVLVIIYKKKENTPIEDFHICLI